MTSPGEKAAAGSDRRRKYASSGMDALKSRSKRLPSFIKVCHHHFILLVSAAGSDPTIYYVPTYKKRCQDILDGADLEYIT